VLDDLATIKVNTIFYKGQPVAREGKPLFSTYQPRGGKPTGTVNIKPFPIETLKITARGEASSPVIEVVPGQIITRKRLEKPKVADGFVVPDTGRDILKLVVIERHKATGNIGRGLVSGFGLQRGALDFLP